jgi:hypothetical protein
MSSFRQQDAPVGHHGHQPVSGDAVYGIVVGAGGGWISGPMVPPQ